MRDFIPSDYVDKEGNVYETIGENIREGKNGSGSGSEITDISQLEPKQTIDRSEVLIGKNGSLSWQPIVDINYFNNVINPPSASSIYSFVNKRIPEQKESNTTQALMAYNGTPRWAGIKTSNTLFKNDLTTLVTVGSVASWVESFYPYANSSSNNATIISVIYDTESDTYTMEELADNPDHITISSSGGFISSTDSHKSVFDLHPISTTNTRLNSAPITKGFTSYGTMMVGWNIKMNYKAVVISGTKREG